jgi:putative SOS response-associated peptidase YedK
MKRHRDQGPNIMSSIYRIDVDALKIGETFGADPGNDPWAGGYIVPGKPAPVILRNNDGDRYFAPRIWGVPPPQSFTTALQTQKYRPVTTVRNTDSPFWIGTLRHTEFRCLIPVTALQFWCDAPDLLTGKRRQNIVKIPTQPVFALAGIWRDSEVVSFAYLTTEPNTLIGSVHRKSMPVILAREDHEPWLTANWETAKTLLEPYPSKFMAMSRI